MNLTERVDKNHVTLKNNPYIFPDPIEDFPLFGIDIFKHARVSFDYITKRWKHAPGDYIDEVEHIQGLFMSEVSDFYINVMSFNGSKPNMSKIYVTQNIINFKIHD